MLPSNTNPDLILHAITKLQCQNLLNLVPVTIHKLGGLVHAPINCTTFLWRTFLQNKRRETWTWAGKQLKGREFNQSFQVKVDQDLVFDIQEGW